MKSAEVVLPEDQFEAWLRTGVPPRAELLTRFGVGYDRWSVESFRSRRVVVRRFGFAIPCREAIEAVVQAGPVIELGAGTGFWSALIKRAGGDILACDIDDQKYQFDVGKYHDVEKCDASHFVRQHPDRHALIVWPSHDGDWACQAAENLAAGRLLFLVGEDQGGCTGNDRLFDYLGEAFDQVQVISLPVWIGIHDYMAIYRKR